MSTLTESDLKQFFKIKFFDNYDKRHGILKVLEMPEAVSLDDIYTTVQLLL